MTTTTGASDLESVARALTAAFEASDWAAMAALYEPDGEILSAGRPRIAGRATIEALLRQFPPVHLRKSRNALTDVQQSGDLGWVLFDVATREVAKPGEAPVERLSRVALLCRRRDGRWHIWRDVDGPSPDPQRMRELLDGDPGGA
ncbi:MAG: nuclear transport factor 2 family protein [Steroidobacteraceae bacterium]|nr:nuclear transport factor 2 family protein [Steroidobacteraceae bacterium]